MSTIVTLRDLFSRRVKGTGTTDEERAALAKFILLESVRQKDNTSFLNDAAQQNRDLATKAKEALALLTLWNQGDTAMPATLAVLLDVLLPAWANSFVDLEKEIADALLALDGLETGEQGQLEEALRRCAKDHLHYQPQKLLRILAKATDKHNKSVVQWAATTHARMVPTGHLRFAAQCLLGCDTQNDFPPQLEEAAKHYIEAAAKTLNAAKKVRFTELRGGPYKPMGEECILRTSALVDFVWVTSKMGETLEQSTDYASEWLAAAEGQLLEQLGPREQRGFDVNLIVQIYPHVTEWFARRNELKPLKTVLRTV